MALPAGVKITSITQAPFISAGNQVSTQTTYRYTVEDHGPFTITLKGADDTPANVQMQVQQRINSLRELGAIT